MTCAGPSVVAHRLSKRTVSSGSDGRSAAFIQSSLPLMHPEAAHVAPLAAKLPCWETQSFSDVSMQSPQTQQAPTHSSGMPLPSSSSESPLAISQPSSMPFSLQSFSHSSGTPLASQSMLVPALISQSSGMSFSLQSGSHSSGMVLALQSWVIPFTKSHSSGIPLPLQSGEDPSAISHSSRSPLLLQSRKGLAGSQGQSSAVRNAPRPWENATSW